VKKRGKDEKVLCVGGADAFDLGAIEERTAGGVLMDVQGAFPDGIFGTRCETIRAGVLASVHKRTVIVGKRSRGVKWGKHWGQKKKKLKKSTRPGG